MPVQQGSQSGGGRKRGPAPFKQRDLMKALRATQAVGMPVQRIEIDTAGKIIVVTGEPMSNDLNSGVGEWDNV